MPRRRDLNQLAQSEPNLYNTLIGEMKAFLTGREDLILAHERDDFIDHHNRLLPDHRKYIGMMEQFFIDGGHPELVPLPKWDASKPIPPGFEYVVRVRDNSLPHHVRPLNHTPINPLYNNGPRPSVPPELRPPLLHERFSNLQSLAEFIGTHNENNFHTKCHAALGGPMLSEFTAAGALIFWPLHAFLDDVYFDWQMGKSNLFWTGRFSGSGQTEILFYSRSDHNWWLGRFRGPDRTSLEWTLAGNTAGFGQLADGRPFWTGKFSGSLNTELLFLSPSDHNWWHGKFSGTNLSWRLAGNTSGFGQLADGRPIWASDFSIVNQTNILFYSPSDHNWFIARMSGGNLVWKKAGNTSGFGPLADGRPFWTGKFRSAETSILFYSPSDHNWWLGSFVGADRTTLDWVKAGNTAGFGKLNDGRPFWTGEFGGSANRTNILFYSRGDHNWWLGYFGGPNYTNLIWTLVGNTSGFGNVADGRPFWTGNFSGTNRADILFYSPTDNNWWLGLFQGPSGHQLDWVKAGNTAGFGKLNDGRPFWTGDFDGAGLIDILFHSPSDNNWWLGRFTGTNLNWKLAGNTDGFGRIWAVGE